MPCRLRPVVAITVLGLLPFTVVVAGVPASSEAARVVAATTPQRQSTPPGLRAHAAEALPGESVVLTARRPRARGFRKLSRQERRTARVVLQRRVGERWVRVDGTRLGLRNGVRMSYTAPTDTPGTTGTTGTTGMVRLRTVVKVRTWHRTRSGRRAVRTRSFWGGRTAVAVVPQQLSIAPRGLIAGERVTFSARVSPERVGRVMRVQVHDQGSWRDLGAPVAARSGVADLAVDAPSHPVWYRVVAEPADGQPALISEPVRTELERVPTAIAHRAGAGTAPELTLAAVRRALAAGVRSMEVDVQLTQDGVPVLVHDRSLRRTTDVARVFPDRADAPLAAFTLEELKRLDAGSWFGPEFAGERVPTLDELLGVLDRHTHLMIEVKLPAEPGNRRIGEVLGRKLRSGELGRLATADRLSVSSFDRRWLRTFAESHPDVPVGALMFSPPRGDALAELRTWADELHPHFLGSDRAEIAAARAVGLGTSLWTVNSVADYRRAVALGADRIITDFPERLAEVTDPPRPPE